MGAEYGLSKDFIFKEAVQYLKKKKPLSKEEYQALDQESRAMAFTVSGFTEATVLQTFMDTLETAVEEGQTKEQFRERMNQFLSENGYAGISKWRSDTIFRNNVQTAFNVGHYKSMSNETTKKLRPYWKYNTAGDKDVRASHQEMEDKIYHADDPIWDIWYPPNGHCCRCNVTSLSKRQVEQGDLKIETEPPYHLDLETGELLPAFPDKGFSNNPAKKVWKPDTSSLSSEVKTCLEKRNKKRNLSNTE